MNRDQLVDAWLREEQVAHVHGWDFSHIHGRYDEERDLPWSYEEVLRSYLTPEARLLDVDTGGAEFLLSLDHPHGKTAATEGYPPNVRLCDERLLPLGIDFRETDAAVSLPFTSGSFDVVANRHGDVNEGEVARVLAPCGVFVTEQVGAENDRELVRMLLGDVPLPFPGQYLNAATKRLDSCGLEVVDGREAFRPIRFYDVGALVWFAHVIEWEFPGFSVRGCLDQLFACQEILDRDGVIEGTIHRYLVVARKA